MIFSIFLSSCFRASYRDSAFLWGDPETVQGPGLSAPVYKASYTKNGTLNGEMSEKAEMRPLMGKSMFFLLGFWTFRFIYSLPVMLRCTVETLRETKKI